MRKKLAISFLFSVLVGYSIGVFSAYSENKVCPFSNNCCGKFKISGNTGCCCSENSGGYCTKGQPYEIGEKACCKGVIYDTKKQVCNKKGVVVDKPIAELGAPCGDDVYFPADRVCCNGVVASKSKCKKCKSTQYDSETQECCADGKVAEKGRCCNGVSMKSYEACCNGTVYSTNSFSSQGCCAGVIYNSKTHDCCNDKIIDRSKEQCCTNLVTPKGKCGQCRRKEYDSVAKRTYYVYAPYNTDTHTCCGSGEYEAIAKVVEKNRCCGSQELMTPLEEGEQCCGHSRYNPQKGLACCAAQIYNPQEYVCCGGKVVKADKCCNGKVVEEGQVCCSGVITAASLCRECNGETYNPKTHVCCGGGDQASVTLADKCIRCAGAPYDSKKYKCIDGKIIDKTLACGRSVLKDGQQCCWDTEPYYPDVQECCSVPSASNDVTQPSVVPKGTCGNCNGSKYDMREWKCGNSGIGKCSSALTSSWYPRYCTKGLVSEMGCGPDGLTSVPKFNPNTHQCCGLTVSKIGRCCNSAPLKDGYKCVYSPKINDYIHVPNETPTCRLIGENKIGAGSNYYEALIQDGYACCYSEEKGYGKLYKPERQECCYGDIVTPGTCVVKLCDGKGYNANTHECCGGTTVTEKGKCCRGVILEQGQVCCGGYVVGPDTQYGCCGGQPFDRSTQQCCEGHGLTNGRVDSSTVGHEIIPIDHKCSTCISNYNQSGTNSIYGAAWPYDATTHACCAVSLDKSNITTIVPREKCCKGSLDGGRSSYNFLRPEGMECCGLKAVTPGKCGICGKETYDTSKYDCCDTAKGVTAEKGKCCGGKELQTGEGCCNGKIYETASYVCCKGAVRKTCSQQNTSVSTPVETPVETSTRAVVSTDSSAKSDTSKKSKVKKEVKPVKRPTGAKKSVL